MTRTRPTPQDNPSTPCQLVTARVAAAAAIKMVGSLVATYPVLCGHDGGGVWPHRAHKQKKTVAQKNQNDARGANKALG